MTEENISPKIKLKDVDKAKKYIIEEINQNEVIRQKHKKVCGILNYIEHLIILDSTVFGCFSISALVSSVCIPVGITSSAIGLNICVINKKT